MLGGLITVMKFITGFEYYIVLPGRRKDFLPSAKDGGLVQQRMASVRGFHGCDIIYTIGKGPREPLIKSECRTNSMSLRDLKRAAARRDP